MQDLSKIIRKRFNDEDNVSPEASSPLVSCTCAAIGIFFTAFKLGLRWPALGADTYVVRVLRPDGGFPTLLLAEAPAFQDQPEPFQFVLAWVGHLLDAQLGRCGGRPTTGKPTTPALGQGGGNTPLSRFVAPAPFGRMSAGYSGRSLPARSSSRNRVKDLKKDPPGAPLRSTASNVLPVLSRLGSGLHYLTVGA